MPIRGFPCSVFSSTRRLTYLATAFCTYKVVRQKTIPVAMEMKSTSFEDHIIRLLPSNENNWRMFYVRGSYFEFDYRSLVCSTSSREVECLEIPALAFGFSLMEYVSNRNESSLFVSITLPLYCEPRVPGRVTDDRTFISSRFVSDVCTPVQAKGFTGLDVPRPAMGLRRRLKALLMSCTADDMREKKDST